MCVQPTRTVCQIWFSPWRASGWWALAMTKVWAGCAPRVAACWGDTTSLPGPPAYSILHSTNVCTVYNRMSHWCGLNPDSRIRYDHETQHAFIGDYSGQITLLKLEKQTYTIITTLKGHEGKDAQPHPAYTPCRLWITFITDRYTEVDNGCRSLFNSFLLSFSLHAHLCRKHCSYSS